MPASLALIMLGMGLSLTVEDFRKVIIEPKALIIGLISQMIVLPLIAFLIASLMHLPYELKIGLVIIASCPSGATSNLVTYLLRGNVALAISMTTVNSILTLITTPLMIDLAFILFLGENEVIALPVIPTIVKIFLITLLPAITGIMIRNYRKELAIRLERHSRYVLPVIFGIIYLVAIFGSKKEHPSELFNLYLAVTPYVLLLNISGMTLGLVLARIMKLSVRNQISLTSEVGIHNSALAITIASSKMFLNNFTMAIPAIVYGFFTFVTVFLFGLAIKKWSR